MQNLRPKLIILAFAMAATVVLDVNSAKSAIITAGDIVRIDTDQNVKSGFFGGEYALYKRTGSGAEDWEFVTKTFCLERLADIDTGRDGNGNYFEYVVAAVSGKVVSDEAPNEPADPLSDPTKFLYYAYQAGILDSFDLGSGTNYQYNNSNWAQSLQNAIWKLEDDGVYMAKDEDLLINLANNEAANYTAQYDTSVFALNLFQKGTDLSGFDINDSSTWDSSSSLNGTHIQDLLWYSNPVPEPSTIAIWSLAGLGGLGLAIRRRRKKK